MPLKDAETIAESSAFVVLNHYGIDSSEYTFPYVAGWAEDLQVLKRNLAGIQKTAHALISATERFMPDPVVEEIAERVRHNYYT